MKSGAENRKKTIIAGALGMAGLVCLFVLYNEVFGGPSTPPPAPPVITNAPTAAATTSGSKSSSSSSSSNAKPATPGGNAPGVAAVKMASTSSSLDPTLDESAMLRTENLVYSGSGRNIFSATYVPPPATTLVKPIASARPAQTGPVMPPMPIGPPPPPPINLKFFGTAKRGNGAMQAFLLSGEDVYLAAEGDIVARKYKVGTITANGVQVTDLQNNNTQMLPVQRN
jgi:hypothetical protein